MRIAIDIRNIGKKRTGDETVFFQLVRELAKIDSENEYFLCIDRRAKEEISEIQTRLEIEKTKNFHIKQFFSGNKFIWNAVVMPKFLRQESIDVYHTQYIVPFFVPRRTKIVTHIHDVSFRAYPEFISLLDRFFLALLVGRSLRRADAIAAISDFTASEIVKYYGERMKPKVHVVPNAVGSSVGYPIDDPARERMGAVRKKYALPEKYILYVGTHQPRKNLPTLLKAFDKAADQLRNVSLVLTGNRGAHNEDPKIKEVLGAIEHSKKVIFTGYVDAQDLPALYAGAHVFAQPSFYEGFDIPALEAMDLGVPVVLSDIPVHREVAGKAAAYADPKSVESFTKVLYDSCVDESLRASLREEGIRRRSVFSWSRSARLLLELYMSLT